LRDDGLMPRVATMRVALYGSFGLTDLGHGSPAVTAVRVLPGPEGMKLLVLVALSAYRG
jgi:hypothetical protein